MRLALLGTAPAWGGEQQRQELEEIGLPQPFPARRPAAAGRWQQALGWKWMARKLAQGGCAVKTRSAEVEGLNGLSDRKRWPWPPSR